MLELQLAVQVCLLKKEPQPSDPSSELPASSPSKLFLLFSFQNCYPSCFLLVSFPGISSDLPLTIQRGHPQPCLALPEMKPLPEALPHLPVCQHTSGSKH